MSISNQYQVESQCSLLTQLCQTVHLTSDHLSFYESIKALRGILFDLELYVRTKSERFSSRLPHSLLVYILTYINRTSFSLYQPVCKNWFHVLRSNIAEKVWLSVLPTRYRIASRIHRWSPIHKIKVNKQNIFIQKTKDLKVVNVYSKHEFKLIRKIKNSQDINWFDVSDNYLVFGVQNALAKILDANDSREILLCPVEKHCAIDNEAVYFLSDKGILLIITIKTDIHESHRLSFWGSISSFDVSNGYIYISTRARHVFIFSRYDFQMLGAFEFEFNYSPGLLWITGDTITLIGKKNQLIVLTHQGKVLFEWNFRFPLPLILDCWNEDLYFASSTALYIARRN